MHFARQSAPAATGWPANPAALPVSKVRAPLIGECYANFECKRVDSSLIRKYSLFVWEVVKAQAATAPEIPRTIPYWGDGIFMISETDTRRYRRHFKPGNL